MNLVSLRAREERRLARLFARMRTLVRRRLQVRGEASARLAVGMRAGRDCARSLAGLVGDLVLPPLCLACHQPLAGHDSLCAACWRDVTFITPPLCDRLGIPLPFDPGGGAIVSAAAAADPPDYDRARAVAHYTGVVRDLIHSFKYADQHAPRHMFTRWLLQAGRELMADGPIVVPVPMHRRRLLARRFNQSAILAGDLASAVGLTFEPELLVRRRRTMSQVGLTRDQRRRNLQGAIEVADGAADVLFGRAVLLVDDVITTGTTAAACARSLKRAGAIRVDVVALAMVTDESRVNP